MREPEKPAPSKSSETTIRPLSSDWQPIETAPKDGTSILIWHTIHGLRYVDFAWFTGGVGHGPNGGPHWRNYEGDHLDPKGWMPLPNPPTALLLSEGPRQEQKNDGAELAAGANDTTVVSNQRQETRVIGACPRDGRYWENQCARCGSSLHFHECDNCAGEGFIEDEDWQADPGDGHDCDWCNGTGGHWSCISSVEYCEGNPITNRADVKRGTVEWFTFDQVKA